MKKMAWMLAAVMVLSFALAGCGNDTPSSTPAPTEPQTTQAPETTKAPETTPAPTEAPTTEAPTTEAAVKVEPGTSWNSFKDFHQEADPDSVWQYYFFDPEDSSYNEMQIFIDHDDMDIHSWYPWEGSWVGVGLNKGEFNNVYGDLLEQNADGPEGMISVIGFVAPADGEYLVTGKLMNAFDQEAAPYRVLLADGTEVVSEDYREYIKGGYTFLTPTKVTLKAGDVLYFQPGSVKDWVSSYSDLTVYYETTDESLMVKPEGFIPEPDYPTLEMEITGALYDARRDLNDKSSTDGPFVYAITSDGKTFEALPEFIEREWDDDPDPDAREWYMNNDDYVGVGINADVDTFLEVNVEKPFAESGRAGALGFKAPEDGKYSLTVYTKNVFEQNAKVVKAVLNGEEIAEIPFTTFGNAVMLDVELKAGEVVYFFGVSEGDWVSAYMNIYVNSYSATRDFNTESATDGTWVYAITKDGKTFDPQGEYIEREWDDDPDPDACEWYLNKDDYTGIGFNADVPGWLEANVSNSFANGGSAAALGFKAPEAGKYELTVCAINQFGQNGGDVVLSLNGEEVGTVSFVDVPFAGTFTVELQAGDIVYIHGTSNNDWVSAYLQAAANKLAE